MKNLTKVIKATLAYAFNRGASSYDTINGVRTAVFDTGFGQQYMPNPYFLQPPLAMEQRNGLDLISQSYVLPEKVSPRELQDYAVTLFRDMETGRLDEKTYTASLRQVYDFLEEKNPDLKKLAFDRADSMDLYDVILGVASAISVRDMQPYLNGTSGQDAERDTAYAELREKLQKDLGLLEWVPTMQTMRDIEVIASRKKPKPRQPQIPSPSGRGLG